MNPTFTHHTSSGSVAAACPSATRHRHCHGLTLVEVMLSLTIIATAAMGGLAALLFSFRVSDANLRGVMALAAARSVAEQAKTLDYTTLSGSTLPIDLPSSSTGSLLVDQWNSRTDDIHGTTSDTSDDLVLSIRPEVTQSSAASGLICSQVIVRYRWEQNSFFAQRTREESLTVLVSHMPNY